MHIQQAMSSTAVTRPTAKPVASPSAQSLPSISAYSSDYTVAHAKPAQAITSIALLDSSNELNDMLDQAIDKLSSHHSPFNWDERPMTTFAEREAEMTQSLLRDLNEKEPSVDGTRWRYRFSDKELQNQIKKFKTEINDINRQRAMGMTDCWGGLTNRQVACEAAVRALETCLKERHRTVGSLRPLEPRVQICGPFPWERRIPEPIMPLGH